MGNICENEISLVAEEIERNYTEIELENNLSNSTKDKITKIPVNVAQLDIDVSEKQVEPRKTVKKKTESTESSSFDKTNDEIPFVESKPVETITLFDSKTIPDRKLDTDVQQKHETKEDSRFNSNSATTIDALDSNIDKDLKIGNVKQIQESKDENL